MPRVVTHLGLRRRRQLDGDLPNCWLEVMLFLFLTTFFHRQPIGTVLSRIGEQVPHSVVGQTRHIWMLFRTKFAGGQKNITFFARFALVTPGSLLLLRKSCRCSFFFVFLWGRSCKLLSLNGFVPEKVFLASGNTLGAPPATARTC